MSRVAVLTDSNSGITQAAGKELGVGILPMPFLLTEKNILKRSPYPRRSFMSV